MNDIQTSIPPKLPGIDVGFGLKQCLDNTDLFQNLLHKFLEDYRNAADKLHALSGVKEEQNRLLHTVLGVATNLGLFEVGAWCQNIREDLKSSNFVADAAIAGFHKELEKVDSSIKTLDSCLQS